MFQIRDKQFYLSLNIPKEKMDVINKNQVMIRRQDDDLERS